MTILPVMPDVTSNTSKPTLDAPVAPLMRSNVNILPFNGPGDCDRAAIVPGAIVRILRGPHAGIVGVVKFVHLEAALIGYVVPKLKRRRRFVRIQFDSAFSEWKNGDRVPSKDPKIGDPGSAHGPGWFAGSVTVIARRPESVTVSTIDGPEDVELVVTPILEVLVAPTVRLPGGTIAPLVETVATAFGDALLDIFYAQGVI